MTATAPENAALDALADALAPRLYERIKAMAEAERAAGSDDAETLAFIERLRAARG